MCSVSWSTGHGITHILVKIFNKSLCNNKSLNKQIEPGVDETIEHLIEIDSGANQEVEDIFFWHEYYQNLHLVWPIHISKIT